MTITIGVWIIPVVLTLLCLFLMLRPYHPQGDYDFGFIFRAGWLIPIGFIWAIYFAVLLWIKS